MKIFFNDETVLDFDKVGENLQDLFQRFAPFNNMGNFNTSHLEHLDDFALRALERRLTARRDTLNDALDLIRQEFARRQSSPSEDIAPAE
ncbi:MAG: hypothetical protein C7B46_19075 [Sulfobacillus benefaciens]|uniref:Uncharacterized protein n=1 Tax=Sulfobacillus benefaciens TaxID=453960 RepID=A0A2T2X0Z7_9FIRM|nr:MAG: hypothetical protein C7B46_19075 [Sulfobacillus benefaciens]